MVRRHEGQQQPGNCSEMKNQRVSPGEHVTRLLHLVAWDVMLHVWFVDPSLDVDDLLPVVIRHGRAVDLV